MSGNITLNLGDDIAFVVSGTIIATCLDNDGVEVVRTLDIGKPRTSQKIGLLTMALDKARGSTNRVWDE